jgi:hypothetical protein
MREAPTQPLTARVILLAQKALGIARDAAARHAARRDEVGERLADLAKGDHPELLCEPGGELSARLRHTGLVRARGVLAGKGARGREGGDRGEEGEIQGPLRTRLRTRVRFVSDLEDDSQRPCMCRLQVVDRKLSDYEQMEVLQGRRQHVFLVRHNQRVSVLKEIANTNEKARKVFENEVRLCSGRLVLHPRPLSLSPLSLSPLSPLSLSPLSLSRSLAP